MQHGLNKSFPERRSDKRHRAKEGSYVVIDTRIGQLADISKGGLAFVYLADKEQLQDSLEIDLFCTDQKFYIEKLAVQTVTDQLFSETSDFSSTVLRRRGVRFTELTNEQFALLDKFIAQRTNLKA